MGKTKEKKEISVVKKNSVSMMEKIIEPEKKIFFDVKHIMKSNEREKKTISMAISTSQRWWCSK